MNITRRIIEIQYPYKQPMKKLRHTLTIKNMLDNALILNLRGFIKDYVSRAMSLMHIKFLATISIVVAIKRLTNFLGKNY